MFCSGSLSIVRDLAAVMLYVQSVLTTRGGGRAAVVEESFRFTANTRFNQLLLLTTGMLIQWNAFVKTLPEIRPLKE